MGHFDLHCDTLRKCLANRESLMTNSYDVSVERGLFLSPWIQVFAASVPEELRGVKAYRHFLKQAEIFHNTAKENEKFCVFDPENIRTDACNGILAVANGTALGKKLERIQEFKELGVRLFALVWNGENDFGGGINSEAGLSKLGAEAARRLTEAGIAIDVSHMNGATFWDLCDATDAPLVASHSNCFSLCPHLRNLDDLQIQEIIRRKGLIGVNFYPVFVNGESDCSFQEIRQHIRKIVALGGEDCIAVGSDFDGAAMPANLNRIEKIASWHENLRKHFPEEFVEKITYKNALDFFCRNSR